MKQIVLILLAVLIGVVIIAAQDDQGNPNDPRINERANACYEDGSMAYKCDEEWEWVCGWYLIRFEYGLISREAFPSDCAILGSLSEIPPAGPPTNTPIPPITLTPTVPTMPTITPSFTDTPTDTPTSTNTNTPTRTSTPTLTNTPTDTSTPTDTNTPTDTPEPEATAEV